jgi:hypothetical protein
MVRLMKKLDPIQHLITRKYPNEKSIAQFSCSYAHTRRKGVGIEYIVFEKNKVKKKYSYI